MIDMLIIFIVVLFFYLHIQFHLKQCNDLEIYQFDDIQQYNLNELSRLKQPVKFTESYDNSLLQTTILSYILDHYSGDAPPELRKIFQDQSEPMSVFLDHNNKIVDKYLSHYLKFDSYLISPQDFFISRQYDIWFGATSHSPFQYMINYRTFISPTEYPIDVILTTPNCSSRYFYPQYNYDNMTFQSPINPWDCDDKISKHLITVTLDPFQYLLIPPGWMFSVKFDKPTSLVCFKYDTAMNKMANGIHWAKYMISDLTSKYSIRTSTNASKCKYKKIKK